MLVISLPLERAAVLDKVDVRSYKLHQFKKMQLKNVVRQKTVNYNLGVASIFSTDINTLYKQLSTHLIKKKKTAYGCYWLLSLTFHSFHKHYTPLYNYFVFEINYYRMYFRKNLFKLANIIINCVPYGKFLIVH